MAQTPGGTQYAEDRASDSNSRSKGGGAVGMCPRTSKPLSGMVTLLSHKAKHVSAATLSFVFAATIQIGKLSTLHTRPCFNTFEVPDQLSTKQS